MVAELLLAQVGDAQHVDLLAVLDPRDALPVVPQLAVESTVSKAVDHVLVSSAESVQGALGVKLG